jgi:hypothetical protein
LRSAGLEFATLGGSAAPNIELLVTERLTQ